MLDATKILKKLKLKDDGVYDNHFYVITLKNSDEYAKLYSDLSENAINTEYPSFATNTNKTTVKVTNYFEIDVDSITYNIFLIADFDEDRYYLKIGEQ